MSRLKAEETVRVTVRLPVLVYKQFQQFAFHRVWSDAQAGAFLISHALKGQQRKDK